MLNYTSLYLDISTSSHLVLDRLSKNQEDEEEEENEQH